jgi:hypothetical protein
MDREVFSKVAEGTYFNNTFVNVRYDMDSGEGARLKKQYNVSGFPTYLFIDADGNVVHKIFGAFTREGEFLAFAKLATAPGERTADLEQRYRNGERSPRMMFSYLRMLRLTGQQEKEKQLSKDYLALISKDHFMDAGYWEIIKFFIQDPMSREFRILIDNREEIGAAIGLKEVDEKITEVILFRLGELSENSSAEIDEVQEQKLIEFLRNSNFPRAKELQAKALAYRHIRNHDWEMLAAVVDAMLEFRLLDSSDDQLKTFDSFANILGNSTFEKKYLKRALKWSEYACEKETRPAMKEAFMQTRARLIMKLGS